jgi:type III secretory pathway component EscS
MSTAAMLQLLERALVLCLASVLPPLLGASLCGGFVDLVQGRFGITEPAAPALARILGGLVALLLFAPWIGGEVVRFSAALWTMLPTLLAAGS